MTVGEPDSDGELVVRMASGDRSALAALYDRHAAALLALGRRILGDAREAEDVVHDVFLEVWRRAGDHDAARGPVRSWIVMRMRSRALDRRRSPRTARRVAIDHADDAPVTAVGSDTAVAIAPDCARVQKALADLPSEQRAVLELGYYEGLSSTEIAARSGIPIAAVKSRVATALARLRAALGGGLP